MNNLTYFCKGLKYICEPKIKTILKALIWTTLFLFIASFCLLWFAEVTFYIQTKYSDEVMEFALDGKDNPTHAVIFVFNIIMFAFSFTVGASSLALLILIGLCIYDHKIIIANINSRIEFIITTGKKNGN